MHEFGESLRVGVVATLKMFADQTPNLLFISLLKNDAMNDFDVTTDDVRQFGGKW